MFPNKSHSLCHLITRFRWSFVIRRWPLTGMQQMNRFESKIEETNELHREDIASNEPAIGSPEQRRIQYIVVIRIRRIDSRRIHRTQTMQINKLQMQRTVENSRCRSFASHS